MLDMLAGGLLFCGTMVVNVFLLLLLYSCLLVEGCQHLSEAGGLGKPSSTEGYMFLFLVLVLALWYFQYKLLIYLALVYECEVFFLHLQYTYSKSSLFFCVLHTGVLS